VISEAEVHEALERLNDSVRLAQCSLVAALPQIAALEPLRQRAQKLRALLLEAIEALAPPRPVPFGSLESRAYDVLTLHYIERSSVVEIAEELSLSRRQVHRDLKQAEERLAQLLSSWSDTAGAGDGAGSEASPASEELALFAQNPTEVRLGTALCDAVALVEPLARQLAVEVRLPPALGELPVILADRAFLNQMLTQVLSLSIQACNSGSINVTVRCSGGDVAVRIGFRPADHEQLEARLRQAQRLLQPQASISLSDGDEPSTVTVSLTLPTGKPPVLLVVEDNPGAIELYRRYLASSNWQVQAATDPRATYELTRRLHPDVVVLDLMMPHVDGWSVLRTLKGHPDTADVPVIVCSVVDDPALTRALGAVCSLPKPVSRADLLLALNRCLESRSRPAPSSGQ
jgi:CheY-like chemotaxis protein